MFQRHLDMKVRVLQVDEDQPVPGLCSFCLLLLSTQILTIFSCICMQTHNSFIYHVHTLHSNPTYLKELLMTFFVLFSPFSMQPITFISWYVNGICLQAKRIKVINHHLKLKAGICLLQETRLNNSEQQVLTGPEYNL